MAKRYGLTTVGSIFAVDARAPAACTIEESGFDGNEFFVKARMPGHDEGDPLHLTGLDETTLAYRLGDVQFTDENGVPLPMEDCVAQPDAKSIVKPLTTADAGLLVEFRFPGNAGDRVAFAVAAADTV